MLFEKLNSTLIVNGLLSDEEIRKRIKITPFAEKSDDDEISYGLGSYGYDMRLADYILICTKPKLEQRSCPGILDPKNVDTRLFKKVKGKVFLLPPRSFALGYSLEKFKIPRDVLAVCVGKSTYARCGIIVNVTPLEPEWEGHVTIEISNTTPVITKIYAGEGIAQLLFFSAEKECAVSYADKQGIYNYQPPEVVLSKIRKSI